jgi:hypothetical protein
MKNLIALLFTLLSLTVVSQQSQSFIYEIDTVFQTKSGFSINKPIIKVEALHIKDFPMKARVEFSTYVDTTAYDAGSSKIELISYSTGEPFNIYPYTVIDSTNLPNLNPVDFPNVYINIFSKCLGVTEEKFTWRLWP